jgi:hypothetical protein
MLAPVRCPLELVDVLRRKTHRSRSEGIIFLPRRQDARPDGGSGVRDHRSADGVAGRLPASGRPVRPCSSRCPVTSTGTSRCSRRRTSGCCCRCAGGCSGRWRRWRRPAGRRRRGPLRNSGCRSPSIRLWPLSARARGRPGVLRVLDGPNCSTRGTYLHRLERCGLRVERGLLLEVGAGRLRRVLSVNLPTCGCPGGRRSVVIAAG